MNTKKGFSEILLIISGALFLGWGSYFYLNNGQELISESFLNNKQANITFVGDMMFDRQIRRIIDQNGYENLFDSVKDYFSEKDLVVGNLEGPITDYDSIYKDSLISNSYTFTFDPKIAKVLYDSNIHLVFLDNNHMFDFGGSGLEKTLDNLTKNNINYFGNPNNRKPVSYEINDIKFTFVSYNQFIKKNPEETIKNIKEVDSVSDFVVVYTHWGDEYFKEPNQEQIKLAHSFIDNGADLIIGTHPHVVQSKEMYKGKYIYYSLGNFIFDQFFNEDVSCGVVVDFTFNKDEVISVSEKFVKLDKEDIVSFSDCLYTVPVMIKT